MTASAVNHLPGRPRLPVPELPAGYRWGHAARWRHHLTRALHVADPRNQLACSRGFADPGPVTAGSARCSRCVLWLRRTQHTGELLAAAEALADRLRSRAFCLEHPEHPPESPVPQRCARCAERAAYAQWLRYLATTTTQPPKKGRTAGVLGR